jgi:cytochrome oxidase Cu insertion factor (SCO1/SenC/PrrC family)
MLAMGRAARAGIVVFVVVLSSLARSQVLPKPQIVSAEGKAAPAFTLKDQEGKDFRLSSLRGKRVILIFYRGYW